MDPQGNPPADLGGLVLPSSSESAGDSATTAGDGASAAIVRQRKQRSDAGKSRKAGAGEPTQNLPAISQQQFAQLYSPALWEKAVCAPADAASAITGNKIWEVSTKEREAVGASCSVAAQCFAIQDPKWLAASLAIITVLDMYGVRLGIYLAEKKREREAKEKAQKIAAQQNSTR